MRIGVLLALGLHVLVWGVIFPIRLHGPPRSSTMVAAVLFIGLSQLAYLVPASFLFLALKQPRTAVGIGVVAGITILLNMACFPLLVGGVGPL